MRKMIVFLMGVLSGSVVGAAIALLLAPASGVEIREQMTGRYRSMEEEVRSAAVARRAEMERQLQELRAPRKSV